MEILLLNGDDWTLTCYWPHFWRMGRAENAGFGSASPPLSATVPGAVHTDLLAAGLIPDWQNGLEAFKSEWVSNREWSLRRTVTVPTDFEGRITLECDGLDYSGHVLIDGRVTADFEGTHLRHGFDLTGLVRPGQTFELEFLFHVAPTLEGQIGWTSHTRQFKPRFGYCWDWVPRLVNVGIWQDVRLVARGESRLAACRVIPRLDEDLTTGRVRVAGRVEGAAAHLCFALTDHAGRILAAGEQEAQPGGFELTIQADGVAVWWPAGLGEQPLYTLRVELIGPDGKVSDRMERTVGFKQVRWLANPGAPADAEPFLCEINGYPLPLRGVNWVPLSPFYGTVSAARYETFLRLYRHLHVNLLRVWGGGILETPTFYDLCDRLGLLVWQEFPLSSSGIENWPPEDPEVIGQLERLAAEYIERRAHHACHLLWCGGNELQGGLDGGKVGIGRPVDWSHPLMQRWRQRVAELDPGKRLLCTSPTGPRFTVEPAAVGQGLHHMVHGPWSNLPLAERYEFFNRDDALFRSEVGAPGCSSLAALERHRGDQSLWPPSRANVHWLNPGALWAPWEDVTREFGPFPDDAAQLPHVVRASRYLQAESYRYVAESVRRRFPACSGLIIWMGHDCVHCTANNSLVQIDGSTKPAFDWLRKAWAPRHVSLRHERISYLPGEMFEGEVWCHLDPRAAAMCPRCGCEPAVCHCSVSSAPASAAALTGHVSARLRTLTGQTISEWQAEVTGVGPSLCVGRVSFQVPACPEELFLIEIEWDDDGRCVDNRYLLSQQHDHPLAPLAQLPPASVSRHLDAPGQAAIRNDGPSPAVGVRLIPARPDLVLLADTGFLILLPGEKRVIGYEIIALADASAASAPTANADLRVEWFNA